jgi:hypothetical protein
MTKQELEAEVQRLRQRVAWLERALRRIADRDEEWFQLPLVCTMATMADEVNAAAAFAAEQLREAERRSDVDP